MSTTDERQVWNALGSNQAEWLRPAQVELLKGRIVSRLGLDPQDCVRTTERVDLLPMFIRLADANDARILTFVRRWGVLGLCPEHRLPSSAAVHRPDGESPTCFRGIQRNLREPVEAYRQVAREFLSVQETWRQVTLRAAAEKERGRARTPGRVNTHTGELGTYDALGKAESTDRHAVPSSTWLVFESLFDNLDWGSLVANPRRVLPIPVSDERQLLAAVMTRMIDRVGAGLRVRWDIDSAHPSMDLAAPGLLGLLTMRLMTQTSGLAILPICEACHQFYTPTRNDPRNRWCAGCRKQATRNEAMKTYRAKKKAMQNPNG